MKLRDIRFLNIISLRGPNLWTYRPVLEAWVDIGELEECPSDTLPGFVERLCRWLPGLAGHRCSYGEPGGFVRRLHEGTWPAHILEHVAIEFQNLAGANVGFGRARETGVRGIYKVAVRSEQDDLTLACLHAARELVMAAIEDTPFDADATVARLRELAGRLLLDPGTACIVDAATGKERGIPAIRLPASNLVQLGYGSRQRRLWATRTDRSGAIAEGIGRDSGITDRLLERCGLPVPVRMPVTDRDAAWQAAEEIGLPVVVRIDSGWPRQAGRVAADRGQFEAAYREASDTGATVTIEGGTCGTRHRLLVVGGSLVAATRLDTAADLTDRVHPATAAAACLAARVVGLDIAGVDVMADDISCPLSPQRGTIDAVRAGPDLDVFLGPAGGQARPVGRAIVDHLFPAGDSGRIPVVGITGSTGLGAIARLVAEFLRLGGYHAGVACGDGLFLDRRQVEAGDRGTWECGRRLLMNRSVEAAVVENGAEVILGQGLAYDRCQVGVVARIEPARHFGRFYIETHEQLFRVMRCQVDVVLPDGTAVLDATDPMAIEMAPLCDGEVMYFAIAPDLPVLVEHRARGGRAVFVRDGALVLAAADEDPPITPLSSIPFIACGRQAAGCLESVLAAVGAAWALGIALHVIRTGVETFVPDPAEPSSPGSPDPLDPYSIENLA